MLHNLAQRELWAHRRNKAGHKAEACDRLHGVAVQVDPTARVWRGSDRDPEDHEPGGSRKGWQHEASSRVEQVRESLFTCMSPSDRALVRSQSGPGGGVAYSASPSSMLTRIETPLFRVLVQRRLRLSLPLSQRNCGCGLLLTLLAITARHVLGQGRWAEEDLLWKAHLQGPAGKQADGWPQTCSSATWTWAYHALATTDCSRSSLMVFPSSEERSWLSTPLSSRP